MKKIYTLIALILCCLVVLCSCEDKPYQFYKNRALAIQSESNEYSLKITEEISEGKLYYKLTRDNYVSKEYLIDPDNDDKDDIEFYNDNGVYAYMSKRVLHVFNNGKLYDLDTTYFRNNSASFNKIELIWTERYDVKPSDVPNFIVGAVMFDNNLFILAQNIDWLVGFDREHTTNLWKFDLTNGKLTFCGFCADKNGDLHYLGDGANLAIVKK